MSRSARLQAWADRGSLTEGPRGPVFWFDQGEGPATLLLHGFPSSTSEWAAVVDGLLKAGRRVIGFDMYGYGFSAKPFDDPRITLGSQADLAERLVRSVGLDRVQVLAHDMGDTVAAELGVRAKEGRLDFALDEIVLTNGSIFIDLAQLTPGQQLLLALPDEPLADRLPLEGFKPGLRETFGIQPDEQVLDDLLASVAESEGDRLMPRAIRYIEERRSEQERYTRGLVEAPCPVRAGWGMLDPIAVPSMVDRLQELRPDVEATRWDDIGHWPAIECPERVVALVARAED
jgi:pimeloyl-ACP methyl ester carboxylesterase